jgi:hypothetical protein
MLIPFSLMKASKLLRLLDDYLKFHEDCDLRLYCESVVYDDCYDEHSHEVITDIRMVNDWPLPGESIITSNAEAPGKYLVIFYDSNEETKKRLSKSNFIHA